MQGIFDGKFTKAMRNCFFKDIDKGSLERDPIWQKFYNARQKVRNIALHPYITNDGKRIYKIGENDARNVINDVISIINWIQNKFN